MIYQSLKLWIHYIHMLIIEMIANQGNNMMYKFEFNISFLCL
jgi:hypothetical protein